MIASRRQRMDTDKRILVVEDDDVFARLVSILLVKEGYHVMVAPDGLTALELLSQFQPHLICLDLYLPEVNGWEFLNQYTNQTSSPVPIIVFSARTVAIQSLVGITGFFQKPFDLSLFVAAVNQCFQT